MATLYTRGHGGGCCGITHIYCMTPFEEKDAKKLKYTVDSVVNNCYRPAPAAEGRIDYNNPECPRSILIEVVTTDEQEERNPLLKQTLAELGFVKVTTFCNNNSSNLCYVYHKCTRIE